MDYATYTNENAPFTIKRVLTYTDGKRKGEPAVVDFCQYKSVPEMLDAYKQMYKIDRMAWEYWKYADWDQGFYDGVKDTAEYTFTTRTRQLTVTILSLSSIAQDVFDLKDIDK